jgi:hypothetical protein
MHRDPATAGVAAALSAERARAVVEATFRREHGRIIAALIRLCGSFDRAEEASSKTVLHAAQPLQRTSTATTVRMQDGKPLIVDGPFAETKEQLAGYYLIDCRDLDEAIEWAQKIPSACRGGEGCIEIRPLLELPPR